MIFGRLALLPTVVLIGYRLADVWLMTIGAKKNPYMEGVIPHKFSAQIPRADGTFSDKPADSQVVVFMLGTRNNHPMGLFAPGFKEFGVFFKQMAEDLDEHSEEFGYLGMTSWLAPEQRATQNEMLNVCYFRDYEGLHKFAHSKYHREAWRWYNKTIKDMPHMSIWHETYVVPKGNWESIYANSHAGHLASTKYKVTNKETGEVQWASPVVDASRGLLKTSKGRMSSGDGNEHDNYEASAFVKADAA